MCRRPAPTVHSPVHSGDGQQRDPEGAGPLESERAGGRCSTGSHHIVNQKNTPAFHQTGPLTLESPRHIAAPSSDAQAGLCRRGFLSPERVDRRNPRTPRNAPRQEFGLVESSLPMAPPVKGHGHDRVKAFIARQSLRQQIPQRLRQRLDPCVLVQVDEFAQNALIGTETIGGVETAKTAAAQRATAVGIRGKAFRNGVRQLTQKKSALRGSGVFRHRRQTGKRCTSRKVSPQTRQSSGKKREKRAWEAGRTTQVPKFATAAGLLLEKIHPPLTLLILTESEAPGKRLNPWEAGSLHRGDRRTRRKTRRTPKPFKGFLSAFSSATLRLRGELGVFVSDHHQAMVGAIQLNGFVDPANQVQTVGGQEGEHRIEALLKVTLGIDQAAQ